VQVHHDEGVANRIDPESCASTREGTGEALTGERIGQPLSRDRTLSRGPTPCVWRKAKRPSASSRVLGRPGVVVEPGMHARSLYGNREISDPASCCIGLARIGKARSRSR